MVQGPIVIISGPSGSGKSTLVRQLLENPPIPLRLSVSATTREKREKEVAGVHYHYWSKDEFQQGIAEGKFLEWAEVFGNLYGTPKSEVDDYRQQGIGVILEIDVQGAALVRPLYPDAISIFLQAPSLDIYKQRLLKRGTESPEQLQTRLAEVESELRRSGEFLYRVVNDETDRALVQLRSLIYLEQSVAEMRSIWKTQWEKSEHAQ